MKNVMSIDAIRGVAAPKIVELSGWGADDTFVCKLHKPGIIAMQAKGGIPNPILQTISNMFGGNVAAVVDEKHPDAASNIAESYQHIARAALVEPKLADLEAEGIELTDIQLLEIYAWVFGGIEQIQRFREALRAAAHAHVEAVQDAPVGADGADGAAGDVDGGRGDHGADDADRAGGKTAPADGEDTE